MKKNIIILFLLIFSGSAASAQNAFISADSLITLSEKWSNTDNQKSLIFAKTALKISSLEKDTSTMAASLFNVGLAQYYLSDFDSALHSLQTSYYLYKKINHLKGMSAAANNIGMVYHALSDFANAKKYYKISLRIDISIKDTAGMAFGLNNLGELYHFKQDYEKALHYYLLSEGIDQKAGNMYGVAASWLNIGGIYTETGNMAKGNEYYIKAIEYFTSVNDKRNLPLVLTSLGDNYRLIGNFGQARKLILHAVNISREYQNDLGLIQAQIYYSKLLYDENKPDSAEYWLFEALDKCVETNNNLMACEALMQQGIVLSDNKKYEEANLYLLNAYEFAIDMQYNAALNDILQFLSDNYSALNDFENALKYQKLATAIDEPTNIQKTNTVEKTQTNHADTSAKSIIIGLASGVVLILFLTIIFLYSKMKHYKKLAESHSSTGEKRQ